MSLSANLQGALLMTVGMALFTTADAFVKLAAVTMSTGQVMFWMTAGGAVIFFLMAALQGFRLWHPALVSPVVGLRCIGEIVGATGIVTAFAMAPLSTVSAIMQTLPLLVTLAAALFLGESVGWRRWSAVMVGFVGVLLIVRPGSDGFEPTILWALLGTLGLAIRDVTARISPRAISTSVLSAWSVLAVAPAGLALALVQDGAVLPPEPPWAMLAGLILFGSAGYFLLTLSIRIAELSVVAPFRYTRLLFGVAAGVLVFGERPDALTLVGAAIILVAGLYAMFREQIRAKAEEPSSP